MSVSQATTPLRDAQRRTQAHARLRALEAMTVNELRDEFYLVMGVATPARNKRWLIKKIFYRAQEIMEGRQLSEAFHAKARLLAANAPVRTLPASPQVLPELPAVSAHARVIDPRLPPVGHVIRREHKGELHEVLILEDGFLYTDERYRSLSAIAKAITKTNSNGFRFFRLT